MKMSLKRNMQVMWILKALLACYIVTVLLLLLVSFLLYKFNLSERMVTMGIVSIYAISTFVGGFIAGKIKGERKFLWGSLLGIIYFLLLVMISFGVYRNIDDQASNLMTTFLLCLGGGMLGGMLS